MVLSCDNIKCYNSLKGVGVERVACLVYGVGVYVYCMQWSQMLEYRGVLEYLRNGALSLYIKKPNILH